MSVLSALPAFRPRLIAALNDYSAARFWADVGAGVTVGIVALPLAMAFAIASGLKPEQGIFTAIVGGLVVALLGGSNVQIAGPAGAFIVIVYGIVQRYGLTNLLIATALAGVLLFLLGLLRVGALVRYLPVGIIVGFTNGIAVLIALSQLRDLLGLKIERLPADFFSQIHTYATHIGSWNPHALALGLVCVAGLFTWPRLFTPGGPLPVRMLEGVTLKTASRMPGPIVALVTLSLVAWWLHLPVDTIGSRFGGIPQGLPRLELPAFSWESAKELVIPTLTIALLGAVESLLCARVADNMADLPRHDPNQELMAQGIANMLTPLVGGMPVTGTIARTVTNLRAGATTPIAGIVHALTLLAIVAVAAPFAAHVPLAVLAGILLFVAWNMGEWHEFARLRHFSVRYRAVLLTTFVLTVVFDLGVAVQVGLVMACVFFIWRMGSLFSVAAEPAAAEGVRLFRLSGPLFFGAIGRLEPIAQSVGDGTHTVVLDLQRVISLDSSGVDALAQLHRQLARRGVRLMLCAVDTQPRSLMQRSGFEAVLGADRVFDDAGCACAAAVTSANDGR